MTAPSMLLLSLLLAPFVAVARGGDAGELEADLREVALPLIRAEEAPGLVLGWIDGERTGSFALGRRGRDDEQPMTTGAVFEIGSLTKLFTGLALARFAERGELELGDPLARILPDSMMPPPEGASVRLVDIATHTSGMPEIPANLVRDMTRFVVDYSEYECDDLGRWLRGFRPTSPGTYAYSNAGYGVLGFGLAHLSGKGYEEMLAGEVLEPLGLTTTAIRLRPDAGHRLVTGHDQNGDPVAPMGFACLEGCGALRSDVADMLAFARAALSQESPLEGAFRIAFTPAARAPSGVQVGLAWNLALDGQTWLHDGMTEGFAAFMCVDRGRNLAVVVLTNGATARVTEVGVLALRRMLGIQVSPPQVRVPVELDPEHVARLQGEYSTPGLTIHVSGEADRVYARIPGQAAFRLFPASERSFFYRTIPATIDFDLDDEGRPLALTLHQNGRDTRCPRR